MTPSFSISRLIWIYHFNAILAIPNIRGGYKFLYFIVKLNINLEMNMEKNGIKEEF